MIDYVNNSGQYKRNVPIDEIHQTIHHCSYHLLLVAPLREAVLLDVGTDLRETVWCELGVDLRETTLPRDY